MSEGGSTKARTKGPDIIGGGGGGGYSGGRGPGSPQGEVVYNIPKGMYGLPGPPSYKAPSTGRMGPEAWWTDAKVRNHIDTRPSGSDRRGNPIPFEKRPHEQTPGANLRRALREGADNDLMMESLIQKRGGRIKK